jgi:hypothetical protein
LVRSSTVTIRAPDNAFRDLFLQLLHPGAVTDETTDIVDLGTPNMVELEHNDLGDTAVDAGVRA